MPAANIVSYTYIQAAMTSEKFYYFLMASFVSHFHGSFLIKRKKHTDTNKTKQMENINPDFLLFWH